MTNKTPEARSSRAEYARRYRQDHPLTGEALERYKSYQREYRARNRERIREYNREYRAAHREAINARRRVLRAEGGAGNAD